MNGTLAPRTLPALTATDDDHLWLTDFAANGLDGTYAFAVLDEQLGMQVIADSHLDETTRAAVVDLARKQLADATAPQFAFVDAHGNPSGGAA